MHPKYITIIIINFSYINQVIKNICSELFAATIVGLRWSVV